MCSIDDEANTSGDGAAPLAVEEPGMPGVSARGVSRATCVSERPILPETAACPRRAEDAESSEAAGRLLRSLPTGTTGPARCGQAETGASEEGSGASRERPEVAVERS